jgi:predicted nucleotidyltransferase component of viral defense system
MKETAIRNARKTNDPAQRLNHVREYLQAMVLRSMHEAGAFTTLSFVGGTALRFLFELPRFSEDLDFSLEGPEYDPDFVAKKIERDLARQGYAVEVRWKSDRVVHIGWVRVAELLHDLDLAGLREQKLSVKIEIDTNPPAGAQTEGHLVRKHVLVALRHHDLPSLFAGKVHALLTRSYTKGRDWYDLVWYLTQRPQPEPNGTLLRNALAQSKPSLADVPWRDGVRAALEEMDLSAAVQDVRPFLEDPGEADLLTRENLLSLLR